MGDQESDPMEPSSPDTIDRLIHSPARLKIMIVLASVESADFLFVMKQTSLTRGNLSSHLTKLENAGYIQVMKEFVGKIPRTLLQLTDTGRKAIQKYRENMENVLTKFPEKLQGD